MGFIKNAEYLFCTIYIYIYIFQTLLCAQYLFNLFYFRPQKNREDVKGFENGVYLKFIG